MIFLNVKSHFLYFIQKLTFEYKKIAHFLGGSAPRSPWTPFLEFLPYLLDSIATVFSIFVKSKILFLIPKNRSGGGGAWAPLPPPPPTALVRPPPPPPPPPPKNNIPPAPPPPPPPAKNLGPYRHCLDLH